jgi:hypothetical protein
MADQFIELLLCGARLEAEAESFLKGPEPFQQASCIRLYWLQRRDRSFRTLLLVRQLLYRITPQEHPYFLQKSRGSLGVDPSYLRDPIEARLDNGCLGIAWSQDVRCTRGSAADRGYHDLVAERTSSSFSGCDV